MRSILRVIVEKVAARSAKNAAPSNHPCNQEEGRGTAIMNRRKIVAAVILVVLNIGIEVQAQLTRVPWTTSRVTGSPDSPPPLKTSLRFPNLKFDHPLLVRTDPTGNRIWVVEQRGRIFSFADHAKAEKPDLFVDLKASFTQLTPHSEAAGVDSAYGLAFHPQYPKVPYCWMTYTLRSLKPNQHLEDGTRLSMFRVNIDDDGVPTCHVESERVLLTWLQGGHNGACLEFGPDGYLYVSAGDGEVPNPPDPRDAGQDVSNLLSTIMRIDVSVKDHGPAYRIPSDNPFVELSDARGEIWSYGFRNPWKMTFAPDGELWVGDVGWELYEMVYRVRRGANFGWSIMEGPQPVRPNARRGPTEILPAAIALPHTDAASVTGGYVYRGSRFPELQGSYIFGDFETRRIWSAKFDSDTLTSLTDLVSPSLRLVAFGEDAAGELLLLDYDDGTIHELLANDAAASNQTFPQKLSETGLFKSLNELRPAEGVVPFDIRLPMWNDGATAVRHLAVPGLDPIEILKNPGRRNNWMLRERMRFPIDSVLARTVSLKDDQQKEVRLETQLLHFDGRDWKGYSYIWNTKQTDAELASADGTEIALSDYGSFAERQSWRVHSRGECQRCHNAWVGGLLAFTTPQLNHEAAPLIHHDQAEEAVTSGHSAVENQLTAFHQGGWLSGAVPSADELTQPKHRLAGFASLTEQGHLPGKPELAKWLDSQSRDAIEQMARSYLAVNCSHCHQNGAGGTATIDLRHDIPLQNAGLLDATPAQGLFQLSAAALIKPGQPESSVLLYRLAVSGRGHMPHIGSTAVDTTAIRVLSKWIREQGSDAGDSSPDTPPSATSLSDGSTAMKWMLAITEGRVPEVTRNQILENARLASPEIRGLFDRFQPMEFRTRQRIVIETTKILTTKGDSSIGKQLVADKRLQCVTCHQISRVGGLVGPSLDDVGRRLTREQILDSLLNPSRKIDPKYETWTAVAADGKVISGLLIDRTDQHVVLRNAKAEDVQIPREQIEELNRQATSLMPDRLLQDLTDSEIASILQFLSEQKVDPDQANGRSGN